MWKDAGAVLCCSISMCLAGVMFLLLSCPGPSPTRNTTQYPLNMMHYTHHLTLEAQFCLLYFLVASSRLGDRSDSLDILFMVSFLFSVLKLLKLFMALSVFKETLPIEIICMYPGRVPLQKCSTFTLSTVFNILNVFPCQSITFSKF